jgi:hypothetical protein
MIFPNGKLYFGITSDVKERIRSHRYAQQGRCPKRSITNAIHKYGWDSVLFEVIHSGLSLNDAEAIETKLIAEHDTQDFSKGYNIASGGRVNKGYKHPNIWSKGKTASEETRQRQSDAKKNDPNLRERSSKASTKFPVVATNTVTGESLDFINARDCGDYIGVSQYTVYNHIYRNSLLLAKTWNVRRK